MDEFERHLDLNNGVGCFTNFKIFNVKQAYRCPIISDVNIHCSSHNSTFEKLWHDPPAYGMQGKKT